MAKRTWSLLSVGCLVLLVSACTSLTSGAGHAQPSSVPITASPPGSTLKATEPSATSEPLASPSPMPETPTAAPVIQHFAAGLPLTMSSIAFSSAISGWGVGTAKGDDNQHILKTSDGGHTWVDVTPPVPLDPQGPLQADATFRGEAEAWVAFAPWVPASSSGPQVIWRTTDGGQTWTPSAALEPPPTLEYFSVAQIYFLDEQTGWLWAVLGAGMNHTYIAVYGTHDGGQTWARLLDPDSGGEMMICSKDGLGFANPTTGWLAGDCQGVAQYLYLYRTSDGGTTWDRIELQAPKQAPALFNPDRFFCGGSAPQFSSKSDGAMTITCTDWTANTKQSWLYVTADVGQTWAPRALPAADGALQWLGGGVAWLQAGGAVYRTTDAGASWKTMAQVAWTGQPDFVDQQEGWIVARADQAVALVHSSNGGKNWEEIKPTTR